MPPVPEPELRLSVMLFKSENVTAVLEDVVDAATSLIEALCDPEVNLTLMVPLVLLVMATLVGLEQALLELEPEPQWERSKPRNVMTVKDSAFT